MTTTPTRRRADPLISLANRGLLAVDDAGQNAAMLAAGLQFRDLAHTAEIRILVAADPSRIIVDGGRFAVSDRSTTCRDKLAAAEAVVDRRGLTILRGVVVDERPITDLLHLVADHRGKNAATAAGLNHLRRALNALCIHWSIGTEPKQRAIRKWIAA